MDRRLATCTVKALEVYISAAQIKLSEGLPLYRVLATPRSKEEKARNQGISYTRARELIKDAFRYFTGGSKISAHSLRAGGATSAAMPVPLIDFLSGMAVGRPRTSRIATLRTISILAYQSRSL